MQIRAILIVAGVVLLAAPGCTGQPAPTSDTSAANASSDTSPAAPASDFPPVQLAPAGESAPPLDGGRVQAVMPEGWKFLPRSSNYLFALYHEDKSGVPRIVLTQAGAGDLPDTASAESAAQLRAAILAEAGKEDQVAIDALQLEDNWFVRYQKAKRFRSLPARGVVLETVQAGKRYQIELLTYTDNRDEFLPALYRFAASLEFAPANEDATEPAGEDATEPAAESEPPSDTDQAASEEDAAEEPAAEDASS